MGQCHLSKYDVNIPTEENHILVKPGLNNLILPPVDTSYRDDELAIEAGMSLPTTQGPYAAIRPYEYRLEILEKVSTVPLHNLSIRANQLMHETDGDHITNQVFENQFRERLYGVGLRRTYRRPRVHSARKALNQLAVELLREGEIGRESYVQLNNAFTDFDPLTLRMQKQKRPEFIQSELQSRSTPENFNKWIEKITSFSVTDLEYLPLAVYSNFQFTHYEKT